MGFFKSLFGGSNTPETEKEKNDKKNFEILKYDGIRARHMGKLPYAIKCFEEAVAINDEMETLTLLANAYIQANRLDDARITFNRMAEKEPEQVNTFLSLASICFMQEDYEGMNDACQKALALDDKNPLTYYLTAKAAVGMKEEINAIADNAISHIRGEREKADKEIRRNENRISMTQATFWCMTALLLILATFFALVIFANVKMLHSETLTGMIAIFSVLITVTLVVVALIFYKYSH